jgi:hypothetical protein
LKKDIHVSVFLLRAATLCYRPTDFFTVGR